MARIHAVQAAKVKVRSTAARDIVLTLHGSDGGAIAGRSLDDVLPLFRNQLRPLKKILPYLGDA